MQKEKIAKLKKLAEEGIGGEKLAAQNLLNQLQKKYKQDFSKISSNYQEGGFVTIKKSFKKLPIKSKIKFLYFLFVLGFKNLHLIIGAIALLLLVIILFPIAKIHKFCRYIDLKIIDWKYNRKQQTCKHEFEQINNWYECHKCQKEFIAINNIL